MPRPQNVLVSALAVGLWLGFREIGLTGADHNWHTELELGADNVLYVEQAHSYDAHIRRLPFLKPEGRSKELAGEPVTRADMFSIREIFLAWSVLHSSYEKIDRIARRHVASIRNCSASTFIDAFDRMDLSQFLSGKPPTIGDNRDSSR